jgi:hypothetical protein
VVRVVRVEVAAPEALVALVAAPEARPAAAQAVAVARAVVGVPEEEVVVVVVAECPSVPAAGRKLFQVALRAVGGPPAPGGHHRQAAVRAAVQVAADRAAVPPAPPLLRTSPMRNCERSYAKPPRMTSPSPCPGG